MITEKGSIKVVTTIDERIQKEFTHSSFIFGLIFLIIGSLGLAAYFTIIIASVFITIPEAGWQDALLIFSVVLFAFGLIFVIAINRNIKKMRESVKDGKYFTYEFFNDHFIITEVKGGEKTGYVKVYTNQIIKGRETKNYLFFYLNDNAAYPVMKENLSEAEADTLRRYFKLPVKGDTVTIPKEELPAASAQPHKSEETRNIADLDPFADFDK